MEWLAWVSDPHIWISLITLTVLEIVLGVDNIIFISILSGRLPREQQGKARTMGLMLALITRVLLLCSIFWLTKLTGAFFPQPSPELVAQAAFPLNVLYWIQGLLNHSFSGKDLVLLGGGLFLLWKSVHEIHTNLEGDEHERSAGAGASFVTVLIQIVIIDIVFSLDSVITAVGLVQQIGVMIAAVILAMMVMLVAAGPISDYVNRHPTIKMLALSFLLLVGVVLVADGLGQHVPKGYIYFAMAFSFGVEMLNIRLRSKRSKPIELRKAY